MIGARFRRMLNRFILNPCGFELSLYREDSERSSRVLSAKHAAALENEIAGVASAFIAGSRGLLPESDDTALRSCVRDFTALYEARPVRDNTGGIKFNDSLWLYLIVRLLQPGLIVESGTHQGHSAWLMRQACPDAEIHCFDISLENLLVRAPGVRYHERDWNRSDISAKDGADALCYFDDHVSQARRVREAHARGFRSLVFDDNRSAATLYGTGLPPAPTVSMIFDETLVPGETIEWQRRNKRHSYTFAAEDKEEIDEARSLIAAWAVTPDLAQITRYNPQSGMTLVRLVP